MDEFQELLKYCEEHKHWVTLNYSPYDGTYQCFVNPGRTQTSARRYKEIGDAVRSVWLAMGVKPKTEWVDVKEKTDRKNSLDYSNATTIQVPYSADKVNELYKKATGINPSTLEAMNKIGYNPAGELIAVKRRGRPKGSKNKPKVASND